MQKWEYMVVRSYGGVVMLVNGEEVAEMVDMQPLGQMLYEFLGERGEDGWEVVGMAGIRSGLELILKRPLMVDEVEESIGTEAE
ncbi:MAG: hypothetical protein U9R58_06895 [Chloroflexota bacterium]|nr:hypothetical protein [Chloroflexota bacterium]